MPLILQGKKTLETRFSLTRQPPFARVNVGETIFLKVTGGPIVASAQVDRVWFYSGLTLDEIVRLKAEYNDLVQASGEYWRQKQHSRYATFIALRDVRRMEPTCLADKKDRRAWVTLEQTTGAEGTHP